MPASTVLPWRHRPRETEDTPTRLVLAEMMHETNTFSPIPTPLEAFQMGTGRTAGVRHRRGARALRGHQHQPRRPDRRWQARLEPRSRSRSRAGAPPGQAPRAVVSVISTSLSFSNKHKAVSHRTVESRIGADVAIGPRCNIVGGGTYNAERLDVPMWKQGVRTGYSVLLEDDIWLGAAVSVVGGVRVGHGSIAGAEARAGD